MNGRKAVRSLLFNSSPVIPFNETRHNQKPPLFVFSCIMPLLFLFLLPVTFIFPFMLAELLKLAKLVFCWNSPLKYKHQLQQTWPMEREFRHIFINSVLYS
jgi:hypothetical protein